MVFLLQLSCGVRFVASSTGLVLFCLYADHLIFKREELWKGLPRGVVVRAVSDSLVHGVVGGWCWMNVGIALSEEFNSMRLLQILTCVALASIIDVDHMIEARSLHIEVSGGRVFVIGLGLSVGLLDIYCLFLQGSCPLIKITIKLVKMYLHSNVSS